MTVDAITRAAGLATDWRADAACQSQATDLFYADKGYNHLVQQARKVCSGCPAREACLEWIMAFEGSSGRSNRHGVWAGMTGTERAELYTARARARRASGAAA